MRFCLRTLLIVLALGPPVIALAWWYWTEVALTLLALAVFHPYIVLLSLTRLYDAICQSMGIKPRGDPSEDSN